MIPETPSQPSDNSKDTNEVFPSEIAFQLLQRAHEQFESLQFETALQSCQAALAIYEAIGDLVGKAYSLINIGNVYRSQAVNFYRQAQLIFNTNDVPTGEQMIAQSLADPLESELDWYASIEGKVIKLQSRPPATTPGGEPELDD